MAGFPGLPTKSEPEEWASLVTLSATHELVASDLILWEAKHATRSRGRPATTYIDTLRRDIGLSNTGEICTLMTCGEQPSVIPELVLANTLVFSSRSKF